MRIRHFAAGSLMPKAVCLGFKSMVLHNRHSIAKRVGHPSRALLNHMRQLVGKKELPMRRMRIVLAGGKVQIGTPCKCDGSNGRGFGTDMHTHIREIRAERCFHLGLHVARQRPATGLRTKINLKSVYSGTTLNNCFLLNGS